MGALQYATLTRPDIASSVYKLCHFLQAPTNIQWKAVKRLSRYVKHSFLWFAVLFKFPAISDSRFLVPMIKNLQVVTLFTKVII